MQEATVEKPVCGDKTNAVIAIVGMRRLHLRGYKVAETGECPDR